MPDEVATLASNATPDRIAAVIERIEEHEEEGRQIDLLLRNMGLDAKRLKAIRAAKKTLDALMGVDPATAARVSR